MGVVADQPVQRGGDGASAACLYAADRYAQVFGFDHDADTLGVEMLGVGVHARPRRSYDVRSSSHVASVIVELDPPATVT